MFVSRVMEYEPCLQDGKRPSNKKTAGPDGLEAWCVALAACLINFIMAGLGRMSGILYVAFIDIFQTDRQMASVPFSVRSSMRNLLGPIVGILGQKYSVCAVTVMGGLIGTISAASCFYADNILWITILWGGFNGIGTALTTTLPQVVLGQHFKKYRTTASGMAFSGGCVGSFLFPALLEYLLHTYDLSGTFLIIAGIIFHAVPAAMLLKSPTWMKNKKDANDRRQSSANRVTHTMNNETEKVPCAVEELSNNKASNENSVQIRTSRANNSQELTERLSDIYLIDIELLKLYMNLVIELLTKEFKTGIRFTELDSNDLEPNVIQTELDHLYCEIENIKRSSPSPIEMCVRNLTHNTKFDNSEQINRKVENTDIELQHAAPRSSRASLLLLLEHLLENDKDEVLKLYPNECEHVPLILDNLHHLYRFILKYRNDYLIFNSLTKTPFEKSAIQDSSEQRTHNTFWVHMKTAARLHVNPLFLLICFCRAAHFITFVPAVTVIVDFCMDRGLLEEDGKYIIAALSFGDLLGRLCLGWITDRGYISLPRYMLIVMLLQGASTAILPLMESKATLVITIAVFGLLQGSLFVRHPVLVSMYLGSNEQSIGMGCTNFFSGFLGFALPSYIGYFRDTIGSYNGMFYINGGIGSFIGIMWAFEPFFFKYVKSREGQNIQEPV